MPGAGETLIASSLHAASPTPSAHGGTTLAIAMTPQPGWHGYWKQPGDAGLAPQLTWHLPAGVSVGEPAYPLPQTQRFGGIMNHVYGEPYALLAELTIAEGIPVGTPLPIRLDMQYLACRDDACVPERASLQTTLRVGHGEPDVALAADFAKWRQALPRRSAPLSALPCSSSGCASRCRCPPISPSISPISFAPAGTPSSMPPPSTSNARVICSSSRPRPAPRRPSRSRQPWSSATAWG
ncbi:protein-disulfide reductase DsbD domain-containing protein [Aeromonas dhakensis]